MAGRSQTPSPSTHTNSAHASQEWRGTSGASRQTHTNRNTPARSGGAQPKPEPKHIHPLRIPQPGVAGYKRSAHTSKHTPQHPSQEWRGAAKIRAQARTPQPGVAECQRSAQLSTHTPRHPVQEWRGAAETRVQAHTPTPHTLARSGGVQPERAHKPIHTPTPQPGVEGHSENPSPSTHTNTAHPSQEWRGAAKTRVQAHTPTLHTPVRSGGVQAERAHKHAQPNTPVRSGGAQPKPEPKHTHQHRTPQQGVARYKRSEHINTHKSQHPSQEWRGAAKITTVHPSQEWRGTSRAHTQAHIHPNTPARSGGAQPKSEPKHAHPSQEWRGTSGGHIQARTHPNTPARSGGSQPKPEPKHTDPHRTPQPGVAVYKRSAHTESPALLRNKMSFEFNNEFNDKTHVCRKFPRF